MFLVHIYGYIQTSCLLFLKQAFFALTSSTENKVFAHYIFMENAFSLSTASGFPLKFSVAGVFSPGAKGGLTYSFANVSYLAVNVALHLDVSFKLQLTAPVLFLFTE